MEAAFIAAGGLVLGAAISGVLLRWVESYRWREERRIRRDERRLDAYSVFLGEALLARTTTQWIALGGARRAIEHGRAATRAIAMAGARLNLVADEGVKEAADAMAEAVVQDVGQMTKQVSRRKPIPPDPPEERHEEFRRLRIAFERAVRKERGETE